MSRSKLYFLAGFALASIAASFLLEQWYQVRCRRLAVKQIEEAGGFVYFDHEFSTTVFPDYAMPFSPDRSRTPPGPAAIKRIVGEDFFATVRAVELPPNVDSDVLQQLTSLGDVRFLMLKGVVFDESGLSAIANLSPLDFLQLDSTNVSSESLKRIPTASRLSLNFTAIGNLAIEELSGRRELNSVVMHATSIDKRHYESLKKRRPDLKIWWSQQFSNNHRKACAALERLDGRIVFDTSDRGLEYGVILSKGFALKLGVGRVAQWSGTNSDLGVLRDIERLSRVTFEGDVFSDASVEHLRGLTSVKTVELIDTKITDKGLAVVCLLTDLTSLNVRGSASITDDGVGSIKELRHLKSLDLSRTNISNSGLKKLSSMSLLRELNVQNTKVTKDGVDTFKKAAPRVKIEY